MIYLIYFLYLLPVLFFIALVLWKVIPLSKGGPNVATNDQRLKDMLKLIKFGKTDQVVDLGSGDGKLVIEIAKTGACVTGIEIDPIAVWRSRQKIKKLKLKNAQIMWKSFWKQDLSKYNVVVVYGITYIMKDLEKKFDKELMSGTKVISNYFKLPNWKIKRTSGEVHLYIKS